MRWVSSWIPPAVLSPTTQVLLRVLERFTAFPWAFVVSACRRVGLDPERLEWNELGELIQPLAIQLASLNDVDRAFALKRELTILAGTGVCPGDAA